MNFLRVSRFLNKNLIKRYNSTNCTRDCKVDYLFSPFAASVCVGSIFSIIIKEHVSNELLYVKRQNEEIIARLKKLEQNELN